MPIVQEGFMIGRSRSNVDAGLVAMVTTNNDLVNPHFVSGQWPRQNDFWTQNLCNGEMELKTDGDH